MHIVFLGAEKDAIEDLSDLGHKLTMLYVEHDRALTEMCADRIAHSAFIPSYDRPELAWAALLHLDVVDTVDVVIPAHEFAVVTAAILNRLLGLPERFDPMTALAGRDKALQKSIWHRHGVPTSRFRILTNTPPSVAEFSAAMTDMHPPFVVKPPADGGTHLAYSCPTLDAAFNILSENRELRHAIVEERQSGDEWHFDGALVNGSIKHLMVSRYLAPLIETKSGLTLRSVAYPVRKHTDLYAEALEFSRSAHSALGGKWGVFHLEVFGRPGEFVAGELAWRPPGVLASLSAKYTIGLSLWAAHARILAGETVTAAAPDSDSVYGFVCLPVKPGARNGVTRADIEALPGVIHVRTKIEEGRIMGDMITSTTAVAWALLEAPDIESCEKRINDAVQAVNELHDKKSH